MQQIYFPARYVEILSTLWIHIHNGYISIHTTVVILVIIHINSISSDVSWSVVALNPGGDHHAGGRPTLYSLTFLTHDNW